MKIALVSLGCAKNLCDSEMMYGLFIKNGHSFTNALEEADIFILNTCGFINCAKQESLDTIFKLLSYDKPVFVVGCLAERYLKNLEEEIPEVARFIPIRDYEHFSSLINETLGIEVLKGKLSMLDRALASESGSAYLKIAEGCNNHCAYCAIPLIRGKLKSRSIEDIYLEAKKLAESGVKELVLVAQNTTDYGKDGLGLTLVDLLKKILTIDEFKFIRTLYLYPKDVSDELIDLIASDDRLVPYFDLPFQHVNSRLLTLMNRRDDKESIISLLNKIRSKINNPIIRTTFIVGFPSESEEEFNELLDFIKTYKFTHLGAFTYSREEDTKAYDLKPRISQKVAKRRLNLLLKTQKEIVDEINASFKGVEGDALITKKVKKGVYLCRNEFNAPDDVDGQIILKTNVDLKLGSIHKIKIIGHKSYDLLAELIE